MKRLYQMRRLWQMDRSGNDPGRSRTWLTSEDPVMGMEWLPMGMHNLTAWSSMQQSYYLGWFTTTEYEEARTQNSWHEAFVAKQAEECITCN
jgi:hypothetical protein